MDPGVVAIFIPIVAIVGGIAVAIAAIVSRQRTRQLEIQERIAMIQKGLVPAPEVDPPAFERAMSRIALAHSAPPAGRLRRGGITLVGVGLGLMLLIRLAGRESPSTAIGVGGFFVVIGLALLINSLLEHKPRPATPTESPIPPQSADPN